VAIEPVIDPALASLSVTFFTICDAVTVTVTDEALSGKLLIWYSVPKSPIFETWTVCAGTGRLLHLLIAGIC
jgi:hypothetical protein